MLPTPPKRQEPLFLFAWLGSLWEGKSQKNQDLQQLGGSGGAKTDQSVKVDLPAKLPHRVGTSAPPRRSSPAGPLPHRHLEDERAYWDRQTNSAHNPHVLLIPDHQILPEHWESLALDQGNRWEILGHMLAGLSEKKREIIPHQDT